MKKRWNQWIVSLCSLGVLTQSMWGQTSSDAPAEADARKVFEQRIQKQSAGRIKLLSFKKTDGQKGEVFGVSMYKMDYVLEIAFLENCRWLDHSSYGTRDRGFQTAIEITKQQDKSGWDAWLQMTTDPAFSKGTSVKKGARYEIKGQLEFEKSEMGWHVPGEPILSKEPKLNNSDVQGSGSGHVGTGLPPPNYVSLKSVCPVGTLGEFRHGTKCTGYYDNKGLVDITLAGKETTKEYSKTKGLVHAGVDITAPEGSEIYPIADGIVDDLVSRDKDENFATLGYMVLVEHTAKVAGKATYSIYLHMRDKPSVAVGDKVKAGTTLIGKIGSTGVATGNHTHVEVRQFAGRFSPKWANIYGVERPKDGATFDEKDFEANWIDPEKLSSPADAAITPALVSGNETSALNKSSEQSQATPTLDPEQLLKDCLTSSKGTASFDLQTFGDRYKGRKNRFSGGVEKVNAASGTIVFKPVGQGDYRGVVEARLASSGSVAGGAVKPSDVVTVEGIVSEFAFGKIQLVGRTPRIIKLSGAELIK